MKDKEMTDFIGEHFFHHIFQALNHNFPIFSIQHVEAGACDIETLVGSQEGRQSLLHRISDILDSFHVLRVPTAMRNIELTGRNHKEWLRLWYV